MAWARFDAKSPNVESKTDITTKDPQKRPEIIQNLRGPKLMISRGVISSIAGMFVVIIIPACIRSWLRRRYSLYRVTQTGKQGQVISRLQGVPTRFVELATGTASLTQGFVEIGRRIYLVGGSVRDMIVDSSRPPRSSGLPDESRDPIEVDGSIRSVSPDLDFTTDATPEETERVLRSLRIPTWDQGKRFGTIGCVFEGIKCEITTHRTENYDPGSRKPHVEFSSQIHQDLSRRDFTINAIALSLPDLEIVDPFDGIGDLIARRLRTPIPVSESFNDDPLRMLRTARFIAKGFQPDPDIAQGVSQLKDRLEIVSRERVRDELDKLMIEPDPSQGLWFIVNTGLAEFFLPELPALALEQDPVHRHKDVLAHTIAVVSKTNPDRILRLAALFHDVGKPATRKIGPSGPSFHFHDVVGAKMTRRRMRELRYPGHDIDQVSKLVELHLRFHTYKMGWTDSAVRRYVRDAGEYLARLNELTRCDCTTRNQSKAKALADRMDSLERRIDELKGQEELSALRPDLSGDEVMEVLGLPPGPIIGKALGFLLEIRINEGPLSKEEAIGRLMAWWSDRGDLQTS